jgi:hypothetical protein
MVEEELKHSSEQSPLKNSYSTQHSSIAIPTEKVHLFISAEDLVQVDPLNNSKVYVEVWWVDEWSGNAVRNVKIGQTKPVESLNPDFSDSPIECNYFFD